MLMGRIHRPTVAATDLHYLGSISIDVDLLEAADLLPGQHADVVDITTGARLSRDTVNTLPFAPEPTGVPFEAFRAKRAVGR
ncbi:hypothetical protein GB882_17965, partial [Georgenia ruanii]|nr:hypothetical protein [Georgenia ruanii]